MRTHNGVAARVSCACLAPGSSRGERPGSRGRLPGGTIRTGDEHRMEVAREMDGRRIRALVVDDDHDIAELVRLALTDEGYDVVIASNGSAALAETAATAFDLILLDMRMPVVDGWEFARVYRSRPGPRAPVIVVTAARDAAERAAEVAADGFLAKPFSIEELYEVVARHVRRT